MFALATSGYRARIDSAVFRSPEVCEACRGTEATSRKAEIGSESKFGGVVGCCSSKDRSSQSQPGTPGRALPPPFTVGDSRAQVKPRGLVLKCGTASELCPYL